MLRGESEMWQWGWMAAVWKCTSVQKKVICCWVSPLQKKVEVVEYKLCYDVVLLSSISRPSPVHIRSSSSKPHSLLHLCSRPHILTHYALPPLLCSSLQYQLWPSSSRYAGSHKRRPQHHRRCPCQFPHSFTVFAFSFTKSNLSTGAMLYHGSPYLSPFVPLTSASQLVI